MNRQSMLNTGAICATILAAAAIVGHAGPLDPPAGPVAPTHKTLTQVEPRVPLSPETTPGDADSVFLISQPGSYYLAGNLVGVSAKHGIEIAASNVTLDLNGFAVLGTAGSLNGIVATGAQSSVSIHGGTVADWTGDGVNLTSASDSGLRALGALSNGDKGLSIGEGAVLRDCIAASNGTDGVRFGSHCTVTDCTSSGNGLSGFFGDSGIVRNCTAHVNGGSGIRSGTGSTITGCTATRNERDGIEAVAGSIISGNTCASNGDGVTGAGIHITGLRNRVEGNHLTANTVGLLIDGSNNYVAENTVRENADNYDIANVNQLNILLSELPESIDWPASVTLAGSLTAIPGQHGIIVNAGDVTIDLAGHSLIGVAGSMDGIHIGEADGVVIQNGAIRNWGEAGVSQSAVSRGAVRLERLRTAGNGGDGVFLTARECILRDIVSTNNGQDGLDLRSSAIVENSVARSNDASGIVASSNSIIARSIAIFNRAHGMRVTGESATIRGCNSSGNTQFGMFAPRGSTVSECTVSNNGEHGIDVDVGSTVTGCTARDNGIQDPDDPTNGSGIHASVGSTILACTSSDNTGGGISTPGGQSTIMNCAVHLNSFFGISPGSGSLVIGNTVSETRGDGIALGGDNLVLNNSCRDNGNIGFSGAGIAIGPSLAGNRVQGNHLTDNRTGIQATSLRNLVVGNTAAGTGQYFDIAGQNFSQAINATPSPPVVGDSGGASPGSTDPWINYSQ